MTTTASRKEANKAQRREQILQAAITCFSRKGYHLTTMDDIVAESGMSKGSLYWHYKSKKDILFAVMDWYFGQLTEELMAAIRQAPTAVARLQIIFDIFAETIAAESTVFSVFVDFYAETRHDAEVNETLKRGLSPYIDLISEIVDGGVAAGEFKPVDSRNMAVMLMAATEGLLLYKIILADDYEWGEMGRLFTDTLLSGMAAEGD